MSAGRDSNARSGMRQQQRAKARQRKAEAKVARRNKRKAKRVYNAYLVMSG